MRIVVTGTRGFPGVQGGVETHCEELYPRIAAMGHEVIVTRRKPFVKGDASAGYKGVALTDVYAPSSKYLEAVVHTFLSVVAARRLKADILHVHAVGPALLVPFARLLGLKVVMTNHGADYERKKWGRLARFMLRSGERLGTRFSNGIIAVSEYIKYNLCRKYGREDVVTVYNGVNRPEVSLSDDYLKFLGLERGRYVIALGRFVPEKGFDHLIDAFVKASPAGYRLVIAGDADHEDSFSRSLKDKAAAAGVILPGFVKGEKLRQLMSGAALYVMSSSHEGLPIALLEAMSYGLDVIVSDIPANRIAPLGDGCFYPSGDTESLSMRIGSALEHNPARRSYDLSMYDWDRIASRTVELYRTVLDKQ